MNDSRLNDLFKDFRNMHPEMDYFTQEQIFQFGRMCWHVGFDSCDEKTNIQSKKIIRSDGKRYKSISEAARKNLIDESCIRKALKSGRKSAGYNWIYA